MKRSPMFSVTMRDCAVQTFRSGGAGGQNQNKRDTGVRIIHNASGAIGISRAERSQLMNKRRAFRRMAESHKFQQWVRLEAAKLFGKPSIDDIVDDAMSSKNVKVEVRHQQQWVEVSANEITEKG